MSAPPARRRRGGAHRARRSGTCLVVLFLFAPIATSIVYSFNLGTLGKQTSTFTGWTLHGSRDAWNNVSLRTAVADQPRRVVLVGDRRGDPRHLPRLRAGAAPERAVSAGCSPA